MRIWHAIDGADPGTDDLGYQGTAATPTASAAVLVAEVIGRSPAPARTSRPVGAARWPRGLARDRPRRWPPAAEWRSRMGAARPNPPPSTPLWSRSRPLLQAPSHPQSAHRQADSWPRRSPTAAP